MCTRRLGTLSRSSWSADEVADGKGEGKYVLESLRGFDLFPQTGHVYSHSPTLPTSYLSLAPSTPSVDVSSLLPPMILTPPLLSLQDIHNADICTYHCLADPTLSSPFTHVVALSACNLGKRNVSPAPPNPSSRPPALHCYFLVFTT
jgi:hypothetical protein